MFDAAVLASELEVDGESMVAYVARLPLARLLVATGPGGDWERERLARLAGAAIYLPRPVSAATLGEAFRSRGQTSLGAAEPSRLVAGEPRPP